MSSHFVVPNNLVPHFVLEQYHHQCFSGSFQAATLFVDLSGFTPLTETLMQHQKDGAEALADALRSIFTPLVAEVYARRGIIPLFAGDAFTAIFRVDENSSDVVNAPECWPERTSGSLSAMHAARRARDAAEAIRGWLSNNGRVVQTPYGEFIISATAGLSFGLVQWGIPGNDGNHAFYFRGEAIDGCAAAEHRAEDGQVNADEKFLAALSQKIVCSKEPEHFAKIARSISRQNEGDLGDHVDIAYAAFVHPAILKLTAPAEFRDVCVVFLSFQEPETVDKLHALLAEIIQLSRRCGGFVNQLDFGDMGGYLLLLFGAPAAHENDVARAATFLLTLREKISGVPWRAGVDYGTVWAGLRGGNERTEYGVTGSVVVLACRLFQKAGWNEIWVSEAVYRQLQRTYVLNALGEMQFKGQSQPSAAYRLVRMRRARGRRGSRATQMVGRDRELMRLQRWIEPLFEKCSPGVMIIRGEAGIGKSRLVEEWRSRSKSTKSLLWFEMAGDGVQQRSLGPFRDGLRRFFQRRSGRTFTRDSQYNRRLFELVLDGLIEDLADKGTEGTKIIQELERTSSFLAALVDVHWQNSLYDQLEPQLRFENMLMAIGTFVEALALNQPLMLFLEDLHWFDVDSRQAVESLTRNLAGGNVAILCTTRPTEGEQSIPLPIAEQTPHQTMQLSFLSGCGVEGYAQQLLNGEPAAELVDFLHEKTSGNPLFVEQLVLDLLEQNAVSNENRDGDNRYRLSSTASVSVPSTVSGVLVARLDRLDPAVKDVVQTASVLGGEFELAVLAHMLDGQRNLNDLVHEAQLARVWQPTENGERYLFEHALLRDAAYEMQLRSRLRELHERAGEALQHVYADGLETHFASLAFHYDRGGRAEQAVSWYDCAATEAEKQYANDDAIAYYTCALSLIPAEAFETRFHLLAAREAINDLAGHRNEQRNDLTALQSLLGGRKEKRLFAEIALRRSNFARRVGDFPSATDEARQAAKIGEEERDSALAATAHLAWSRALWKQGHYEKGRAHVDKALAWAEALQEDKIIAQCYMDLGAMAIHQGDSVAAMQAYQKAHEMHRAASERKGVIGSLAMLGTICNETGDYFAALNYYEQALDESTEMGYGYGKDFIEANMGVNFLHLGDYENARVYQERSLDRSRQQREAAAEAINLASLALIHHHTANNRTARDIVQQAEKIQRNIGDRHSLAYTLTYRGHIELALDNLPLALRTYEEALALRRDLREESLSIDALAGLSQIALRQGDTAQAIAYVDEIMTWLTENRAAGVEFPIQVFWRCYLVTQKAEQEGKRGTASSSEILQKGYQLLCQTASQIRDSQMRQTFLKSVLFNRSLLCEWKEQNDSDLKN